MTILLEGVSHLICALPRDGNLACRLCFMAPNDELNYTDYLISNINHQEKKEIHHTRNSTNDHPSLKNHRSPPKPIKYFTLTNYNRNQSMGIFIITMASWSELSTTIHLLPQGLTITTT